MASVNVHTSSQTVDARPVLRRGIGMDTWTRLEAARDEVYWKLSEACEREDVRALVLRTNPYEHPTSVLLECWIPQDGRGAVTARATVLVTIRPMPYHRHEIEYDVTIDDRGKKRTYLRLVQLPVPLVRAILHRLLYRTRLRRPWRIRVRTNIFQFGRPWNRPVVLRTDWLQLATLLAWILTFALLALRQLGAEPAWLFTLLFAMSGAGVMAPLTILALRRDATVRSPGKPSGEPRSLRRVDSWQAVVFGIGDDAEPVRRRVAEALASDVGAVHGQCREERIWYRGLDDIEARDQIVLSFGRGLVFGHVYQYGDDLYVGWDGYLNVGQWFEQPIAFGIDRELALPTTINVLVPGYQALSEYDLIDLSCLMEWVHAHIVRIVKELVEERKVEQEIDFSIVRGERQGLITKPEAERKKKKGNRSEEFISDIARSLKRRS